MENLIIIGLIWVMGLSPQPNKVIIPHTDKAPVIWSTTAPPRAIPDSPNHLKVKFVETKRVTGSYGDQ